MSLEYLWCLQQWELKKEKEINSMDKQMIRTLAEEKESLLAREETLRKEQDNWETLKRMVTKKSHELEQLESRKGALRNQLYSGTVSNPKELSYLEEQVGNLDAKINSLVEDYLELEEKADQMEKTTVMKNKNLMEDKKLYNEKAKKVKKEWEAGKHRVEEINQEIAIQEAAVTPSLLTQYRRLQKRLGIAVVAEVENGFCGGCSIQLPTWLHQQVKLREIVRCENCGRILMSGK